MYSTIHDIFLAGIQSGSWYIFLEHFSPARYAPEGKPSAMKKRRTQFVCPVDVALSVINGKMETHGAVAAEHEAAAFQRLPAAIPHLAIKC